MSANQDADGQLPLVNLITERYGELTGPKRKVADFIVRDPESVIFMSSADVAQAVGCSQPTVSRFASEMGFSGFTEFLTTLRDQVKQRLEPINRMARITSGSTDAAKAFYESLRADQAILQGLSDRVQLKMVERAVELILRAGRVGVAGVRNSQTAAYGMNFLLNQLTGKSALISDSHKDLEELSRLGSEDLLVTISFSRYSKRIMEMTRVAKESGVPVLGITDSPTSPLSRFADVLLCVDCRGPMFQNSMVGALSIVNGLMTALVAAMSEEQREHSQRHMKKSDQISDKLENYLWTFESHK
ncbi:MurR/RpiR family transcriptional regulator [Paenibacillus hamazuiensis]|uniref:MurR/RpiR family transcriptional regulator n=1 Tax=Paenibacillus hamazuiensis TaxID=2936508 RepID=UPI00200F5BFE|nr:MurR/RpiR family transcriptional regulator [Paenibacillus hamazuiensis]